MPQTITLADVRRGWIDCNICGDTLRIFYHHRCPTCHHRIHAARNAGNQTTEGTGQHI